MSGYERLYKKGLRGSFSGSKSACVRWTRRGHETAGLASAPTVASLRLVNTHVRSQDGQEACMIARHITLAITVCAAGCMPIHLREPMLVGEVQDKVEGKGMLTIAFGEKCRIDVVKIEAGSFSMGSDNGGEEERPVHRVTIPRPFFLGVYEVTQDQWEAVMGNNPSQFKGGNHPVEQITWAECQMFLQKLSGMNTKWDFRLPTEAEWEYACRAGTTTKFFFGKTDSALGEYAWCGANSGKKTHPVGQKKANPWGLFDMYGNVWEWVQDRDHANYEGAPNDGSAWESVGGRHHIVRGGSWDDPAKFCRSSSRPQYYPAEKSLRYGFRVACTPRKE